VTIIDTRVLEHRALVAFLREHVQESMAFYVEYDFRKVLIVSAASFIEKRIVDTLHAFASKAADQRIEHVLRNTVFKREKFSSLFEWSGNNVNAFLKQFGEDFKKLLAESISNDLQLSNGAKSFLKLGHLRNNLVHNNFADSSSDQTVEDVYAEYNSAMCFVEFLCQRFDETVAS